MRNRTIFFVLAALLLHISCNKIGANNTLNQSTNGAKTLPRQAISCTPPIFPDVDAFSFQNKVADAPISPAIGGTSDQNAQNNYERIQWCLSKYKRALLTHAGEFPVNHQLVMDHALLISQNGDWPVLRASATNSNSLIYMYTNSRVAFLTINGNKNFLNQPNAAIVHMSGNSNQVDNNWIMGGDITLLKSENTFPRELSGVYIICGDSNVVWNNKIRNNDHGVNVSQLTYGVNNVINGNELFYNRADGVSLQGYAQVINNKIHHNGWDC